MTDAARSYFLNEMDGLKSNDGIFIVGSTNHLDRLDPGFSVNPPPPLSIGLTCVSKVNGLIMLETSVAV